MVWLGFHTILQTEEEVSMCTIGDDSKAQSLKQILDLLSRPSYNRINNIH